MTHPKTPTSSKKSQTRNVKLSDGTTVKTNDKHRSNIKKGLLTKHVVPAKKFSTETGKGHNDWEVTDDLDKSKYPPPNTHPLFRKFWAESIDNVTERSNFQEAHLGLLEALCLLRVELRALDEFIMANGHTFRIVTVLGDQRKTYPEVNERHKVLSHITRYSTVLDLIPKKDKSKGVKKGGDDEGWND